MATTSVCLSDYADKLTVEARKRYVEKLQVNDEILPRAIFTKNDRTISLKMSVRSFLRSAYVGFTKTS